MIVRWNTNLAAKVQPSRNVFGIQTVYTTTSDSEAVTTIGPAKMRRGGLLHGGFAGRLHSFAVLAITIGSMA